MRWLGFIALLWFSLPGTAAERKLVLAHYMPWYESKAVSGQWGWHWTMNKFQPDKVVQGRRELASHYRPLIGAYDSNDPHALECHALLMKFAGIDGAILDRYGIRKHNDYAVIHRNSQHFIKHLKRAGLKFAVCYEDQTVKHMVTAKILPTAQEVPHGQEVMRWLQTNWFWNPVYVQNGDRPLLLVFEPQYFTAAQWPQLTAGLKPAPATYALPHLTAQLPGSNAFGWPPVHGGKRLAPADWNQYLNDLDRRAAKGESIIAAVFPKFHDIYREAGLHDSYGYLDDQNGQTFEQTLDRAWHGKARIIQIATWNDFGEGTIIEPTQEFGYRYLESLQGRRAKIDPAFHFIPADLRLPVMLYQLRKHDPKIKRLDPHYDAIAQQLFANRPVEARKTLLALWNRVKRIVRTAIPIANTRHSGKLGAPHETSIFSVPVYSRADKPNIIFIMADDLGWTELGSYGQKKIKTPHLDQLAREGMRFTANYSGNAVCAPSRCVLMTSIHPGHEVRVAGCLIGKAIAIWMVMHLLGQMSMDMGSPP